MNIRDYFDAEMRLLHEAAQVFAEAYPEQAGKLNLQTLHDRDPYIERLLEGVAYLTAQIRQHIDADLPELSENLLHQLWPQLLAPLPSATIIEFSARKNQLTKSICLPKGTVIQSAPVGEEQTACRFVTTADTVIHPWHITQFTLHVLPQGGTEFLCQIEWVPRISVDAIDWRQLRFYCHADPSVALELYWALTANVQTVDIIINNKMHRLGDQQCIIGCHFSENETLLPLTNRNCHGFHLIHDYFACREKYLFIEIVGLDKLAWPLHTKQFTLKITSRHSMPADYRLEKQHFRLHCVPAINLYAMYSEPLQITQRRFEYPLIAEGQRPESVILHQVDHVEGIHQRSGERMVFCPMADFRHRQEKTMGYFQTITRDSGKHFPWHYILLSDHQQFQPYDITCTLKVSNGHYPRQFLREGMINELIDAPYYLQASNITRPTQLFMPPKRRDYLWQLISCLSFHSQTLADKTRLQSLLQLFEWTAREEHQRRIQAIQCIDLYAMDKIYRGTVMRGIEIQLAMNEEGFRAYADIYLFGKVLHHFFRRYVAMNFFVQTKITCCPSQRVLLWKPQIGQNLPI